MTSSGRTVIDEVKDRLDIVELVGSKVELRRAGKHLKGLCPFHQEKTPSFVVFPERGSYHCFGCGKSGDVISFLMDTENIEFKDALRQLAERAGVSYEQPKPAQPEDDAERRKLHEINRLAARFYNHLLLNSPEAEAARKYLEGRGVERASWELWMLGYAPDSWDTTLKFLKGRGYAPQDILVAGLAVERAGGGHYDRFRKRITFPIRDRDGNYVAFGGRAMGDDTPKYLNSPESPVFVKGAHLYGLDLAQGAIKTQNRAVVVEGYIDAVAAHAHGFENVVATLGTALTPAHVRTLSKLTRYVCLALDADAAGDTAAMRGWEVLRDSAQRRKMEIRSRGRLVSSGSELELTVRIARLPRGEDPDTLIRKSPDTWRDLVENARTVVDHFFTVVRETADLSTPAGRTQAVEELAPVVADLGNPIERAHYEAELARLVGIDEHEIHGVVRSRRGKRGREEAQNFSVISQVTPEELALALLLKHPRLLPSVPPDFMLGLERSQDRELYERMREIGSELTADRLLSTVDDTLKGSAASLVELTQSQPELLSTEQPIELERRLRTIRMRRLKEQINQHSLLLKEAMNAGDEAGVRALLEIVPVLAGEVRELDPPRSPYFKDSREK